MNALGLLGLECGEEKREIEWCFTVAEKNGEGGKWDNCNSIINKIYF